MNVAIRLDEDEGFGAILEAASSLGWKDTFGDATTNWTSDEADACEESALAFLASLGVGVLQPNDNGTFDQINSPTNEECDYWIHFVGPCRLTSG